MENKRNDIINWKELIHMKVIPEMTFGSLTTKWSWKSKDQRIWKCTCKCGGYCYVKENALVDGMVKNCGAECHPEMRHNTLRRAR